MANYWHTSWTSIIWIQHHCIHKVQKPLDSLGLSSFKGGLKSKHPKTWNLFWKTFIAQFKSQYLWQLWEHMAQVVWASVKAPLILLRCCPPDDIFPLACFIRRCQMTFQQRKKESKYGQTYHSLSTFGTLWNKKSNKGGGKLLSCWNCISSNNEKTALRVLLKEGMMQHSGRKKPL